jgi:alcohol dehydrogenase class IV
MGLQFQHATPAFRTFCGERALASLPKELHRLGASRAVLFFGASMRGHRDALARVEEALGTRLAGHFDGVKEHSPVAAVESAVQMLKDLEADAVIAVGGGSAIVTARAATVLLGEDGDVRDLCTQKQPDGKMFSPKLSAPKLPQWVVPTTPTTAYAKAGSALRDPETGERLALFDPKTRAQGVFFDPVLALTAPIDLAVASGLNAFSMSIEGLQTSAGDPLTVALLTHALQILTTSLEQTRGEPDNPEPRLQSMVAALLAGQGSDFAGGGLAQVLSHATGPRSSVSNGVIEAMLLTSAMRYNAPTTSEGLALVANAFASSSSTGGELERCITAVEDLLHNLEVPSRLRDVGVAHESIPEIVEHALGDWALGRVPRAAGTQELTSLLESAW